MNYDARFVNNQIQKIKKELEEKKYLLKQLQILREKAKNWDIVKEYLIVEEGRIDEDSYYDCICLKNDCISEIGSEIEGIHTGMLKKALEVKDE